MNSVRSGEAVSHEGMSPPATRRAPTHPTAVWGTCVGRYGIRWMFNCAEPAVA